MAAKKPSLSVAILGGSPPKKGGPSGTASSLKSGLMRLKKAFDLEDWGAAESAWKSLPCPTMSSESMAEEDEEDEYA